MTLVTFICGCETKDIVARENIETMDLVSFDDEGFLICAVHHARRKGWRSIPVHPDASNVRTKKSYYGRTPLEREARIVFRELWPERELAINPAITEDKRDNRDPQSLVLFIGESWRPGNKMIPMLRATR